MKHFIATHTCFSEEARRAFIENTKALTHKEMIDGTKSEKAKLLAHWMGKDEFFFCHWLAVSEEAIHEVIEDNSVKIYLALAASLPPISLVPN